MASLLKMTLVAGLTLVSIATAQATAQTTPVAGAINPQLVGTWSTKSNKVFTGPVRDLFLFYDISNSDTATQRLNTSVLALRVGG